MEGLTLIKPSVIGDQRGQFFRVFCREAFAKAGLPAVDFVQLNHSSNAHIGTFRGLHFQQPPHAEDKLVRCVHGAIMDIVVDIRKGSSTFLKHQIFPLNSQNHHILWIPKGFAHGFLTLTDHAILAYHHTYPFTPGSEGGLSVFDPKLNIKLPAPINVISERDQQHPHLTDGFTGIAV